VADIFIPIANRRGLSQDAARNHRQGRRRRRVSAAAARPAERGDRNGNGQRHAQVQPEHHLTNIFLAEAGAQNTMLQDNIQLAVKMSTKLALTVGYGVTDNTNPPAPLKKVDTISTVNLQYSF
jgi:putative salt-induced outer membrane protein YdiY